MKNIISKKEKILRMGLILAALLFLIIGIIYLKKDIHYGSTDWEISLTYMNAIINVIYYSTVMLISFLSSLIVLLFFINRLKFEK